MYLERDESSPNGNLSVLLCLNVKLWYYKRVSVIKKRLSKEIGDELLVWWKNE